MSPRTNGDGPTNWGRWGEDDEIGTANLLTGEVILRALNSVREGRIYPLGLQLRSDGPVGGDRISPLHLMSRDGGDFAALGRDDWGTADDYLITATQGTTHLDGLAHIWYGGQLYNGKPYTEVRSSGTAWAGVDKVGGLIAPAHLLDFSGRGAVEITSHDLDDWFSEVGRLAQPGDALLIRTGWMDQRLKDPSTDPTAFPVLAAETINWIADHDISTVGADNIAVEAVGTRGVLPPFHKIAIRDLGLQLLELLDLSDPGSANVSGGMLVVAPLRIARGVGSPVNPLLVT